MARRIFSPGDHCYESLRAGFAWQIPEHFNIGSACTDDHPANDPAIITQRLGGEVEVMSFGALARATNRVANLLLGLGLEAGDRVAIVLPQSAETAIAHLGIHKAGCVALPLAGLFGPDALRFRLENSETDGIVHYERFGKRRRRVRIEPPV